MAVSVPPETGSVQTGPSPIHSATESEMTVQTLTSCTERMREEEGGREGGREGERVGGRERKGRRK